MKQYIRAFALPRKKAINKLDSYSEQLDEHIIKCIIFGTYRPESFDHWAHEVCTWIHSCDSANISGAKLKPKDYEDSLFGYFGDTEQETRENLVQFISGNLYRNHKKDPKGALPYFKINDTMVNNLYNCYNDIKDTCIPILQTSKVHPISYWKTIVKSILIEHRYNFSSDDITETIYDE